MAEELETTGTEEAAGGTINPPQPSPVPQALKDFVATSNSGKYKTEKELMSKFPELKGYDMQALRDFVATSNSGKYKTEGELMSKFPELSPQPKPTQVGKPQAAGQPSGVSASPSAITGKSSVGFAQPEVGVLPSGAVPKKDISEKETAYIQPQVKKDNEARLKSMASDINKINAAKNPKEQRSYFSNLMDNLEMGSAELGATLAAIPESLYSIATIPYDAMAKLTGTSGAYTAEELKKMAGMKNPVMDYYLDESEKLKKKTAEYENQAYKSQGIFKNFKEGNILDGFKQLGTGLAHSLPVSTSMMMGGAATSLPTLMAGSTVALYGGSKKDMEEASPQASELNKNIGALGLAGAETVFSAISDGTLGKVYKDIIFREGEEAGKVMFKEGLVKMYETALKKYGVAASTVGEGIEEVATQVTQNMIKGRPAMEGVPDAFIQGVGGGAGFGAPISISNVANKFQTAHQERQINKVLESDTNDYNNIQDVFKPTEPIKGTDLTADKLKIVQNRGSYDMLNKSLDKSVEKGEITQEQAQASKKDFLDTASSVAKTEAIPFSDEKRLEAVNLIRQKENLQAEIKNMDDDLAAPKKEQVKAISEKLLNLANEATSKPTKPVEAETKGKEEGAKPTSETTGKETVREEVTPTEATSEAKPTEEVTTTPTEEAPAETRPIDTTTSSISEDTKTAINNGVKKQVTSVDENGETQTQEVEFTKEDAVNELNNLETLAKENKLTPEEFQKSYFSQNIDTPTLENSFEKIKSDPIGFVNDLRNAYEGEVAEAPVTEAAPTITETQAPKTIDIGNNTFTLQDNGNLIRTNKSTGKESKVTGTDKSKILKQMKATASTVTETAAKPTAEAKPEPSEITPEQAEKFRTTDSQDRTEAEIEIATEQKARQDYKEKAKATADKIRNLKINSDIRSAASKLNANPLFTVAWDGALETVAQTVELTGNVAQATYAGLEHLRNSDWYKSISDVGKLKAERMFQEDINRAYEVENENTTFGDTLKASYDKVKQTVIQKFFDKYSSVRKFINQEYSGRKSDKTDFSQAEITYHGKTAYDIEKVDKQMEKIFNKMFSKGFTADQVSDYVYAKHATERNAHIKENIDPENEFGSGMTDQEANKILNETYTKEQIKGLEDIAKDLYGVIEDGRQFSKEMGLLSDEDYNTLKDYYKNYVPLVNFENKEIEQNVGIEGNALDIQGNLIRRAAGRSTRADNVILGIIRQRVSMIMKGRKNEVLHTLYENAVENPSKTGMQLFDKESLPKTLTVNADGSIVNRADDTRRDEYVGVKVDGKQFFLKFENKELGKILNAANVEKTGLIHKVLRGYNRYLSSVVTTLSPVFMLTNPTKDMQVAIYNMMAEADINPNLQKNITKRMVIDTPKSIRAIYGNERGGKINTEFQKYYEEFKEEGGKTGWAQQRSPEELRVDIEKHFKKLAADNLSVAGASKAIDNVKNFIEDANSSIENGVRLSAYINGRKAGMSKPQAARLAKELTINFNKSGELGPWTNGLWLFFNAGAQGTARMYRAMATMKKTTLADGTVKKSLNGGQKLALGMVGFSAALTMLNQGLSDDDDDGLSFYEKIPDSVKERNMILMNPANGKEYFKIPLPYGYNIFHNFGMAITEVATKERTVGDAMGFLTSSMISAFSPVSLGQGEGVSGKVVPAVIPTVLKPIYEIQKNEDSFGNQIYNENLPFSTPKPAFARARRTTPETFKATSKFLNEVSGGNGYESGKIDVAPESMYHMYKFVGGGLGRFFSDIGETGGALATGKEVETRKVPFASRFYAEPDKYADQKTFFDRYDKIRQKAQAVEAKDASEEDMYNRSKIKSLANTFKEVSGKLKKLSDKKKAADQIEDDDRREAKLKDIEEKTFSLMKKANKKYNDKLGKNY